MHRGYIKIWRKVKDSGLYQLPNAFTLFVYMLTEATHKPIRFGAVDLERGQLSTGRHILSSTLKMSEQSVRTALKHLHNLGMITSKSTSQYTVYTIVNYNNYQDSTVYPNQQVNQQSTNDQPTANQLLTTIQEYKNTITKKQKQSSEFSDCFIKFWNVWPSHFRKGGKSECWKVWRQRKLDTQIDSIISHVEYCKGNGVWKDQQYIPAPKTYINQSKWDGFETVKQNKDDPIDLDAWMRSKGA